ncbi:MAG: hypothetical protein R3F34_04515 [Planctomycetota bacterium]
MRAAYALVLWFLPGPAPLRLALGGVLGVGAAALILRDRAVRPVIDELKTRRDVLDTEAGLENDPV